MRLCVFLLAFTLPSFVIAQTVGPEAWKGLYQGTAGTLLLRSDGSARIPEDLADPSADGFRWELMDEDRIVVTPYLYQGPRELNQRMDLMPLYFEATVRNGKRVLGYSSMFGDYIFVK